MSTPASSPELTAIAEAIDPRARDAFLSDVARHAHATRPTVRGHLVLVGHRAAGKSRLLAPIAKWLHRPGIDLDAEIAVRAGVSARTLFERSQLEFRRAERAAFCAVEGAAVIAAGGGFLFHHADLLVGHTPVLVPLSFATYAERLAADDTRPRLRPDLTLAEELEVVFREREAVHARAGALPLSQLVAAL